jgi:site-specific DNA recombinase
MTNDALCFVGLEQIAPRGASAAASDASGLAYLLQNRFYIGEVVYRDGVYRGEHQPIVDPALFEAVQNKLAAQAVARRCRLRGSAPLLTGRIFDECGNRMSPTHTNKGGVRYRYYVSQAVLRRKRKRRHRSTVFPLPSLELPHLRLPVVLDVRIQPLVPLLSRVW